MSSPRPCSCLLLYYSLHGSCMHVAGSLPSAKWLQRIQVAVVLYFLWRLGSVHVLSSFLQPKKVCSVTYLWFCAYISLAIHLGEPNLNTSCGFPPNGRHTRILLLASETLHPWFISSIWWCHYLLLLPAKKTISIRIRYVFFLLQVLGLVKIREPVRNSKVEAALKPI
jgi:hypothetical protein